MKHHRQANPAHLGHVVNKASQFPRPGNTVEHKIAKLPPPSKDADEYTIGLLGSEGCSFTVIKLNRTQLQMILALENRIDDYARGSVYSPEFVVYYGGLKNSGTKKDPVWEPAGQRVLKPRIKNR